MSPKYSLALTLVFVTHFISWAQPVFVSTTLHDLYILLPRECQQSIKAGHTNLPCRLSGNSLLIKIEKDKRAQVTHLGLSFFKSGMDSVLPIEISHFIERKFLEYTLINDINTIRELNRQNRILMTINGGNAGTLLFASFNDVISILTNLEQCKIKRDSLTYTIGLVDNSGHTFIIAFPANQSLIMGMDKKELDDQFSWKIKSWQTNPSSLPVMPEDKLISLENGIYKLPGKSFYSILSADIFFKKKGDNFELMFDTAMVNYSFSNGILKAGELCQGKTAIVTQKLYGQLEESYQIKLADLVGYFKNNGFELYFGVEDSSKIKLRGTLVAYYRPLNYINMLDINTSSADFFKQDGEVRISLFANIPYDNIKELFGNFHPEKK
jgi:hypothetical protein